MRRLRFLIIGVATLFATPLFAQDTPFSAELPDSIVITASRMPESIHLLGRRATVWSAVDIARLPVSSFDELLRTVGGVEVLSRAGFGVQSDITMRGSTFNGVLVLIDGVRLNDPMTGHFLADLPLPLSEIARIEVVRGPAAAIYGPDALGGVIQIFTYAGLHEDGTEADRIEVDARAGASGLYYLDVALREPPGLRGLSAAASLEGSGGANIVDGSGRRLRGAGGAIRTDFDRQSQTIAFSRSSDAISYMGRVGRDARDFSAFHFYTPFASDTARESTSTLWGQLGLRGDSGAGRWQVNAGIKTHDDRYVYNAVTPANEHVSRLGQIHAHLSRSVADRLRITHGASLGMRSIESNNLGAHRDASAGVYTDLRWQPFSSFVVAGGGRADYDSAFGVEYTPQVSITHYGGSYGVHLGAGRAVRAPNYVERYINTMLSRPSGGNLGDPTLTAERSWALEAGTSLYPAEGISIHGTLFRRITRDLIDYARLSPEDTVFLARNLHRVRTSGAELDVTIQRPAGRANIRVDGSYTFLGRDLDRADEGVEYKYALTNARQIGQLTASVTRGAITAGLQVLRRDPLEEKAYAVVSVRLGYGRAIRPGRIVFAGEIRNLFDEEYSEIFDAPMPGRWWILGIQYRQD